jgi:hypothetical protein
MEREELKKENEELKKENEKLRKENEELKKENKRLEKMEYYSNTQNYSYLKPQLLQNFVVYFSF